MAISDAVEAVVGLLAGNWSENVKKPDIKAIFDVKRIGGLTASSDYVLVYQGNTSLRDGDITGLSLHFFTSVSIDIRTLASRERLFEILNEVHRILWNKMLSLPNYEVLDLHDARFVDLSDKSVGLWRIVYDIKLKKISEVRG